jgi:hypothetical protein
MSLTSAEFAGPTDSNREHRAPGNGRFMLTLCELAGPVSLRPPQSPQLKPFTFFTSRARQPDGSERLYLHMGYFESLNDAERWAQIARVRYPDAVAAVAPAASGRAPGEDASLTDTQVLKVLEARGAAASQDGADQGNCEQIALLRPDDTSTRQALKEAVVQGAPVFFAVQLHWSAQPIDLSRVPALAIFKAYTLYASETRREGRSRYFLRLGFFADPISAKQVAALVRANYASAAVVPVVEQEVTRAREAGTGGSIPYLEQQRVDQGRDSNTTPGAPPESEPPIKPPRKAARGPATLAQTLAQLAERERWTDPDALSDTGVRHLKVEVQEHTSPRGRL